MRKSHLFLLGLCLCMLAGCNERPEAPEELFVSRNEVKLYAGEEALVHTNQPVQCESVADFIADAYQSGGKSDEFIIKGLHVGYTKIKFSTATESHTCMVKVLPRYNTYEEPAYELFKKPLDDLESLYSYDKRKVQSVGKSSVIMYGEKPSVQSVTYSYHYINNQYNIWAESVGLPLEYKDEVYEFLSERYKCISDTNSMFDFENPYHDNYKIYINVIDEAVVVQYFEY